MNRGVIKEAELSNSGERMRKPVKNIYDRQVARCLADIEDVFDLPAMVCERIKRGIEYACKDVDKINRKESGYGQNEDDETRFNR